MGRSWTVPGWSAAYFRQLFANDERRVHSASGWARLAQELKRGVLSREDPDQLAGLVRREMPRPHIRTGTGHGRRLIAAVPIQPRV